MTLILAMGAIIFSWLLLATAFTGVGLGVTRFVSPRPEPTRSILKGFWLGFAVTVLGLQLWHFVLPVNLGPIVLLILVGAAGLYVNRNEVISSLQSVRRRWVFVVAGVIVLWIANRCIGPPTAFDTGYYDYPVVKWSTSYPVVPGLGNLHDRLGFNNSSLLYVAMLDQAFWRTRSFHLANGLLVAVFMIQIAFSLLRLLDLTNDTPSIQLFDLVLLIPATDLALQHTFLNISSITTDVPLSIVLFTAASLLFRQLVRHRSKSGSSAFELFVVATLFALALTIKLSALFFVIAATPLVIWLWYSIRRAAPSQPGRIAVMSVIFTALILIPWCIRGYILTGYPLYPSTFGAANVDWRVPRLAGLLQQEAIVSIGRVYYDFRLAGTPKDPWFRRWLFNLPQHATVDVVMPAGLICLAFVLACAGWSKERKVSSDGWLLAVPCIFSLVFWILKAPDPRFAFFAFWILAATVISAVAAPVVVNRSARKAFIAFICLATVAVFGIRIFAMLRVGRPQALALLALPPGPDHGLYPLPRRSLATFTTFTTNSGLVLFVPLGEGLIYDAPLLTTPWPERTLQLRRSGDLGAGFRSTVKTNIPQGAQSGVYPGYQ